MDALIFKLIFQRKKIITVHGLGPTFSILKKTCFTNWTFAGVAVIFSE